MLHSLLCVLNAAARLIVKRRKFDRITDSLRDELHWLPVQHRHTYKICLLVYKCLREIAPSYLIEQCIPVAVNPARSSLRSASNRDLVYTRTNLVCYGQSSFSVIGPRTWNQLPPIIGDPTLSFDSVLCVLVRIRDGLTHKRLGVIRVKIYLLLRVYALSDRIRQIK